VTDLPPRKPTSEMQYVEDAGSSFNAWDPKVLKKIDELVALATTANAKSDNADLVQGIIVTALKAQYSQLDRGDVKILNRALRELRYGFRIFKPYRRRPKVTIFGSARTKPREPEYKMAVAFSREMAREGYMVITGAGPGIMMAGNEGAGKNNSFGINIRLPYEQHPNEFISKGTMFIDCRFFFTRKLMFLKETSAVALFPGGFGTFDEGMEVLTLVQTGKADPMPIVMLQRPGDSFWDDWRKYLAKHLLKTGRVSPEDMDIFKVTDSVEEAAAEIVRFYSNYHSLRYVQEMLVLRLRRAPSEETLERLRRDFRDICVAGSTFQSVEAFPEESDHRDLPRIAFVFNRFGFGRLRQLINALNEEGPA